MTTLLEAPPAEPMLESPAVEPVLAPPAVEPVLAPPAVEPMPPPTAVEPAWDDRGRRHGGILAGVILIALGLFMLADQLVPITGGLLFVGLGAAFLIARIVTGRCGYAVPAGLLLGFGAFVSLSDTGAFAGRENGGMFFIMLGLGFALSYIIAASPANVWPIVPAAALIGFGLFLQGFLLGWPLERLVWLAGYWPLALVAVGVWLLVRDRVPAAWRAPLVLLGASALILVGFLVAAAGVISVATLAH
jgi:hypothetical protein